MSRRLVAACLLALCLVPALVAGCAKKRVVTIGNLPPETTLLVQRPLVVDTVNHVVHLYWFGSDPDGYVRGYELRFTNAASPSDSPWVFTTRTDSVFAVFSPSGFAAQMFQVRAIDDSPTPLPPDAAPGSPIGLRDPEPAVEDFTFTNEAPSVGFSNRLQMTGFFKDTTYASVTLTWTADDLDGGTGGSTFEIALDSLGMIPATPDTVVRGNTVTLGPAHFLRGDGPPGTKPRMAFIRAIDDGGRASGWDSQRWVVRAPATLGQRARLLLIDDVTGDLNNPKSLPVNPSNTTLDRLYATTAAAKLPAGSWSVLQLEYTQPFRSAENLLQTFGLFDAVIWYRGTEPKDDIVPQQFSPLLQTYQDALATYLEGGGRLMIESRNLIEGTVGRINTKEVGALRRDWVTRYLGSDSLIRASYTGTVDSTEDWTPATGAIFNSSMYDVTVRNNFQGHGLRGFAVRDTAHVAVWARANQLSPAVPRDIPIAVSVPVPENPPGPGRVVVFTFSIAGANGLGTAGALLGKVFDQLGLFGP